MMITEKAYADALRQVVQLESELHDARKESKELDRQCRDICIAAGIKPDEHYTPLGWIQVLLKERNILDDKLKLVASQVSTLSNATPSKSITLGWFHPGAPGSPWDPKAPCPQLDYRALAQELLKYLARVHPPGSPEKHCMIGEDICPCCRLIARAESALNPNPAATNPKPLGDENNE